MALLPFYRRVLKSQKPLRQPELRLSKPYPATPTTAPECLRKWRIDLRLTVRLAAERLGVDASTYNHWESGKFTPGRHRRVSLAAMLGCKDLPWRAPEHAVDPAS